MFNPTRDQVRQFFIATFEKRTRGLPMTALELQAADIIALHPEYHPLLGGGDAALERDYVPEGGESNPFLHLSLHLAIAEQLSIDQPRGIRATFTRLRQSRGDEHAALHVILECLGETVWRAQREGRAMDAAAYAASLEKAR